MLIRVLMASLFILMLVPFLAFAQEGTTTATTDQTEPEPVQIETKTLRA